MKNTDYEVAERRPIATRELAISKWLTQWLVDHGATGNAISIAGMAGGLLSGIALAATQLSPGWAWLCWLLGALFMQLRLLANMFDGMVAVKSGQASKVGELFNEVPDRVSDAAIFIGMGYAVGSNVTWGYAAAGMAVFVAYVRAMGKVAGAHQEFCGPMAKPQRMALATLMAVASAAVPPAYNPGFAVVALVIVTLGGLVTAWRRISRIAAALRSR